LYDSQGILAVAESPIQVGVPWLSLHGDYSAKEAYLGDTIAYTLTLRNGGVISDSVVLTITLPVGISVLPGSILAAQGNITSSQSLIQWTGEIQPHTQVLIYFSGSGLPDYPGIRLATSVLAVDPYSRRKAWFVVTVRAQYYFPLIAK